MLNVLLLTLALSHNHTGPIDITEQDLTSYVNQKANYQQQYGIPGLFDVNVTLDTMQVKLGRERPDMADVTGHGHFVLALPNKVPVNGTIRAKFEAKPHYDQKSGSIYLQNFNLTQYEIKPDAVQQEFAPLVGYLVQGLQSRLAQQPAYVLDNNDKDQHWLKDHITRFQILPGKLRLYTDK
jgi:hypothetical protein